RDGPPGEQGAHPGEVAAVDAGGVLVQEALDGAGRLVRGRLSSRGHPVTVGATTGTRVTSVTDLRLCRFEGRGATVKREVSPMLRQWIVRLLVLVLLVPTVVVLGGGAVSAAEPPPIPLTAWGERGLDPGQFYLLEWVAVGPDGDVYTTELWGQRVQRFSPDGTLVDWWGTYGEGPGEFSAP